MDIQALANTPIFLLSLVVCAIVATYAFATFLRSIVGGLSRAAASAGLHPDELRAVEHAGIFHNQLETLIERVVALEELASEMPNTFSDHSWSRLLDLCDDLEAARGELHGLLSSKDFVAAAQLGRMLSGATSTIPDIPREPDGLELRKVTYWHKSARDLLQRMVSKLEDAVRYGTGGNTKPPSEDFLRTIEELREALIDDEEL